MEGKTIVSMIAIIMVVNAFHGEATNDVQHPQHHPHPNAPHPHPVVPKAHPQKPHLHPASHNVGTLSKILTTLCGSATYKEECFKSLESVAHNLKATPQTYVEAGVKLALDEINKASKLADALMAKSKTSKNPQMMASAIKTCKESFDNAKDRLQGAIQEVANAKNFKDQAQIFDLRIRLGDVNTFVTSCIDEITQAEVPELQQMIQAGTTEATQLSVDMLDIVTIFNEALAGSTLSRPARRLLAS